MQSGSFSIIAATCYGNRGAQAMLETVIGRLREKHSDLRFHVFSYYPADDRDLISDPAIRVHSSTPLVLVAWIFPLSLFFGSLKLLFGDRVLRIAPPGIRAIAESTALIDLAGVAFIDGREKFLPFNILTLLPAHLLGTPVIKMPQALGPFDGRLNRLAAKIILPLCAFIWARGARTRTHLENSKLTGLRFDQCDDIAFNHKSAYSLTDEEGPELGHRIERIRALQQKSATRGVIGICPSSVVAEKSRRENGSYTDVISSLICSLTGAGFVIALFPNATRSRANGHPRNNDLPLIQRIQRDCNRCNTQTELITFDFDINASGIKQIIAATDIVLVSRFHAMVGALSLAKPPCVLGWSHKYAEVMERFGLTENTLDYSELIDGYLHERIETVFNGKNQQEAQILARLPDILASAEKPLLELLESVRGEKNE